MSYHYLFAGYLSYAALADKNLAINDLGCCLMVGHFGFSKDLSLAIKWLSLIQEDNKFYPNAQIAMGEFYLVMRIQ